MRINFRRALLGAVLLGSVSVGIAGANAAPVRGGTLVYARYADSLFLDPVLNDANVDIWILTNLYDTLLQPTPDGKGVTPGLATEYVVAPDGLSMTLKLRPGIKFADGSPLTSKDVKFSLDRARDPKAGEWNFMVASIETIEVPAADTVVLKLKHPDPTLPAALATFNTAILPEALFNAAPGATPEEKAKAFAEHPVGSGPFILADWKRNSEMVLKRNPYYWAKGEDGQALPYLDEIHFPIIPDDATRLLKLQAGEVDGAEFIPLSRVAELKANPALDMVLFPSTKVSYLTFMVRPKLSDGSDNPLANPKIRQALNYAIDKNAVVQVVTFGQGKPMQSFMSSATPLALTQGPAYPYDLAKAKALLKEAGFEKGFDATIMVLAGNADYVATASIVQQMWGQIGVRLKLDQLDNATLTARYRKGDFQTRTGAWTDDIPDPNEITSYFAYSPNIDSLHSGFKDPVIDADFDKSQVETDPAKRAALYKEIQEHYLMAAPIAFLFESPYPVALKKTVKGFVQIPLGNNVFSATFIAK